MSFREEWARRDVLRGAGLLGLSGLGFALDARNNDVVAADNSGTLNLVYLEGSVTPVFEQLMKAGNYLQKFGVTPNILNVTDGSRVIAALIGGSGDICGGSGFSGVFPAIEKGAKIKIVAGVMMRPQNTIFSRRPDIVSCKDLVGKTVGVGPLGALLHQLAVAALIKNGVDYTKVNFHNVGSVVDVFRAVVAGTVDAGLGTIDVFGQQEKYGVHALTDGVLWKELPDFTNQAMIATDQAIAEKRDLLVKVLAAHALMYRFIASPDSKEAWAKARAAGLHKDEPAEAEGQWKFFNTPAMLATNLVIAPQQFEFAQQLNVRLGAQTKILSFEDTADMSLAQEALKLIA